MWLPTKIYEAIPALYVTVGCLNILGAMYIGFDDGLMPAYMAVGLACVIAGVLVSNVRHAARCGDLPSRRGPQNFAC